jgi:uncharacterized membrane protein YoaK (UPF0700 family)
MWHDVKETLWPAAAAKEDGLPPLLIVLTIVTGVVDALAYLRLGHVFVANMTGNIVFLGFAAAGASGLSVPGSLIALACFLGGGIAAARFAGPLEDERRHTLRRAATVELVLCATAVVVAAVAGQSLGNGSRYALTAVLALAMGVQNATARRLAVAELTTTVLTLTLTGIAADSRLGGRSGARTPRRVLAVGAMLLGALVGATLLLHVALVAPLGLAAALLALIVVATSPRPHRR